MFYTESTDEEHGKSQQKTLQLTAGSGHGRRAGGDSSQCCLIYKRTEAQ